mmetsp:Transcript_5832/g.20573  ORF Transcript_5832/g.20573 Transcript_5832/m.20573 type:complete len:257 (-) Transcript_5832:831-1601(-)
MPPAPSRRPSLRDQRGSHQRAQGFARALQERVVQEPLRYRQHQVPGGHAWLLRLRQGRGTSDVCLGTLQGPGESRTDLSGAQDPTQPLPRSWGFSGARRRTSVPCDPLSARGFDQRVAAGDHSGRGDRELLRVPQVVRAHVRAIHHCHPQGDADASRPSLGPVQGCDAANVGDELRGLQEDRVRHPGLRRLLQSHHARAGTEDLELRLPSKQASKRWNRDAQGHSMDVRMDADEAAHAGLVRRWLSLQERDRRRKP